MTAPEVPEVHPLGGVTRAEALRLYDLGCMLSPLEAEDREFVTDVGRRVVHEIDLLEREESEAPGALKYVIDAHGFTLEPLDGEALAAALEEALDDLQRGYSDTCEGYDEWLKERKRAKKRKKRDRVLLAEAADERVNELQTEIARNDMPRADVSRMKRELKQLEPAVARQWERIQK